VAQYWTPKIERNAERDKIQKKMLKKLGWKVLTIWECELKNVSKLEKKIQKAMLEELR
jgi:DNA mismatch endonuclease (patch repair protein)